MVDYSKWNDIDFNDVEVGSKPLKTLSSLVKGLGVPILHWKDIILEEGKTVFKETPTVVMIKGKWKKTTKITKEVLVKVILPSCPSFFLEKHKFILEAERLCVFHKHHFTNIPTIYGVVEGILPPELNFIGSGESFALVLENFPKRAFPLADYFHFTPKKMVKFTNYDKMHILYQILLSLSELHALGYQYGFLFPTVIYLNHHHPPLMKFSNFQYATTAALLLELEKTNKAIVASCSEDIRAILSSTEKEISSLIKYLSPEILSPFQSDKEIALSSILSPAADLYAFGMLCWEIFTSRDQSFPPSGISSSQEIIHHLLNGLRPDLSSLQSQFSLPAQFVAMIERCWNSDPLTRPTSEECLSILQNCLDQLEEQEEEEGDRNSIEGGSFVATKDEEEANEDRSLRSTRSGDSPTQMLLTQESKQPKSSISISTQKVGSKESSVASSTRSRSSSSSSVASSSSSAAENENEPINEEGKEEERKGETSEIIAILEEDPEKEGVTVDPAFTSDLKIEVELIDHDANAPSTTSPVIIQPDLLQWLQDHQLDQDPVFLQRLLDHSIVSLSALVALEETILVQEIALPLKGLSKRSLIQGWKQLKGMTLSAPSDHPLITKLSRPSTPSVAVEKDILTSQNTQEASALTEPSARSSFTSSSETAYEEEHQLQKSEKGKEEEMNVISLLEKEESSSTTTISGPAINTTALTVDVEQATKAPLTTTPVIIQPDLLQWLQDHQLDQDPVFLQRLLDHSIVSLSALVALEETILVQEIALPLKGLSKRSLIQGWKQLKGMTLSAPSDHPLIAKLSKPPANASTVVAAVEKESEVSSPARVKSVDSSPGRGSPSSSMLKTLDRELILFLNEQMIFQPEITKALKGVNILSKKDFVSMTEEQERMIAKQLRPITRKKFLAVRNEWRQTPPPPSISSGAVRKDQKGPEEVSAPSAPPLLFPASVSESTDPVSRSDLPVVAPVQTNESLTPPIPTTNTTGNPAAAASSSASIVLNAVDPAHSASSTANATPTNTTANSRQNRCQGCSLLTTKKYFCENCIHRYEQTTQKAFPNTCYHCFYCGRRSLPKDFCEQCYPLLQLSDTNTDTTANAVEIAEQARVSILQRCLETDRYFCYHCGQENHQRTNRHHCLRCHKPAKMLQKIREEVKELQKKNKKKKVNATTTSTTHSASNTSNPVAAPPSKSSGLSVLSWFGLGSSKKNAAAAAAAAASQSNTTNNSPSPSNSNNSTTTSLANAPPPSSTTATTANPPAPSTTSPRRCLECQEITRKRYFCEKCIREHERRTGKVFSGNCLRCRLCEQHWTMNEDGICRSCATV